jgi:alcohol dehydrogenase class IV
MGRLAAQLHASGVGVVRYRVRGEPTTAIADDGARLALASRCDCVIGLGGGSVLDAAKAISGLMTNGGDALDYVEIVGRGRAMESPASPFLAIPTTAGTGAEATKNAVLTEPRARVKVSMRSPLLLPAAALIDAELTHSLPATLTASTGLDALTQLLEAAITPRANPFTDLFALEGIARSARSLARALREPGDAAAREDLALASLLGGLSLANSGLGAVHGIAAPLGGRHPVPHGVACAVLLPHVFETNLRALRERDPGGAGLARIGRASEVLISSWRDENGAAADESDADAPDAAAALLLRLVASCRLPGLGSFGVARADISPLAEASLRSSSMKGNPGRARAEIEAAAPRRAEAGRPRRDACGRHGVPAASLRRGRAFARGDMDGYRIASGLVWYINSLSRRVPQEAHAFFA